MQSIIIFSVFREEFSDVNTKNYLSTLRLLQASGMNPIEAIGSYKGTQEKSFIVPLNDYNLNEVMTLAKLFNQESILVIFKDSQAELVFPSNMERINLGEFKEVSKNKALSSEAYTFVPSTNTYYLAE